jgi:HSP20 family protein
MELKKIIPWNWFKKEEESDQAIPVTHREKQSDALGRYYHPLPYFHRDFDLMLDRYFREFGLPQTAGGKIPVSMFDANGLLKPKVDLSASAKEYVLTVEIPGVNDKDVSLDISGNLMTIKGEKKQEKEEKEKDYYRIERSYGSFQRVLSLPEDVDQDAIKAGFKHGVLTVTMPRKALPAKEGKQIKITAQ